MAGPESWLVDYVDAKQLVAPWKDHKALLRAEEDEFRLKEENERGGYRYYNL